MAPSVVDRRKAPPRIPESLLWYSSQSPSPLTWWCEGGSRQAEGEGLEARYWPESLSHFQCSRPLNHSRGCTQHGLRWKNEPSETHGQVTAEGDPSLCGSGSGRHHLRDRAICSRHLGPSASAANPSLALAARRQLEPSLLHQWPCVCDLNPAPSDEPTSLGMSAEGSLRRAIVPPFGPAVRVDEGHSSPRTFANKGETAAGLEWRVATHCLW